MSILSSIGSAISGAYNTVKNAVSSVFSGPSQSASALNYNNPQNNALQTARANPGVPLPIFQGANYTPIPSGSNYTAAPRTTSSSSSFSAPPAAGYTPLPVTISAGAQRTSGGTSTASSTSSFSSVAAPQQSRTISNALLGGGTSCSSNHIKHLAFVV